MNDKQKYILEQMTGICYLLSITADKIIQKDYMPQDVQEEFFERSANQLCPIIRLICEEFGVSREEHIKIINQVDREFDKQVKIAKIKAIKH